MTPTDDAACLDEVAIMRIATGHGARPAALDEHLDRCDVCRQLVAAALRLTRTSAPGAPDALTLEPGDRVGRYVLLGRLGEGGAGVVFRAHDPDLDRDVAVKILYPTTDPSTLLWEARTMARLSDPHIVPVYDVGTAGDSVYVVMQHIRGGTLQLWQATAPRWRLVVDRYLEAGRGLLAAHAAGVLHGDFKPSNVLLGDRGQAMVADFGLAAQLDVSVGGFDDSTLTGAGTPLFAAPEVHRGDSFDARADQFSFCVALAWALQGRPPFDGETIDALYRAKCDEALVKAEARLPRALWPILDKGLRADPAMRHATLADCLGALQRVRDRGRRLSQGGVLVSVAGVALAAGALGASGREPGPSCPDPEQSLADVWNAAERDALLSRARALEAPAVLEATQSTAERLDAYVAAHAELSLAICHSGPQPADPRVDCLRRRRSALESLVVELRGADRQGLAHSVAAAWELPKVADCDRDPTTAWARSQERRAWALELDRTRIIRDLGRVDDAHARATDLLGRVQAGIDPWMEAEVRRELCLQMQERHDAKAAWEHCELASRLAMQGDNHRTLAWAWTTLVALGSHAGVSEDAVAVYDGLAEGAAERVGEPEGLARLLAYRGDVLDYQAKPKEARALYEEALAISVDAYGPNDVRSAKRMIDLAGVLPMLGDSRESLELVLRAREGLRASIGERTWLIAHTFMLEGQAWAALSESHAPSESSLRTEQAQASDHAYEESWRRLAALFGPDSPRALIARALFLQQRVRREDAPAGTIEELEAVVAALRATDDVDARAVGVLRFFWVSVLINLERYQDGVDECVPLAKEMSDRYGDQNVLTGAVHYACGTLLERLDRHEEALVHHQAGYEARLRGGGLELSATLYSAYSLAATRVRLGTVDAELVGMLERALASARRLGTPDDLIDGLEALLEQTRSTIGTPG